MQKLKERILNPNSVIIIINILATLIFCGGSIALVIVGFEEKGFLSILAYVLFALSAISLTHTVYIIVKKAPTVKKKLVNLLERNSVTAQFIHNFGFRTVMNTIISFSVSIIYGLYNGVIAIIYSSIWYGALATYYILLMITFGGIALFHKNKKKKEFSKITELNVYLKTGILITALVTALSSAVILMVTEGAAFIKVGWLIYAAAAYTFYKLTISIINIFRARKMSDYTVRAARGINLSDAAVSLLALQTSLLQAFSDGSGSALANALTGGAVCAFTLVVGIYMIVTAVLEKKKMKEIDDGRKGE